MVIQEYRQNRSSDEEIGQRLFEEKVVIIDVPNRGIMRFEFGKNEKPGGFPYFVRIEIKNISTSDKGSRFIPFGGVDSKSKPGVFNSLLVEWPHFDRKLFEQALINKENELLTTVVS